MPPPVLPGLAVAPAPPILSEPAWTGRAVVLGPPEAMGSKRAFRVQKRTVIVDERRAELRRWQDGMRQAMQESAPRVPVNVAVAVRVTVYLARPASHYGTGRNAGRLRDSAPHLPRTGRDLDKVTRAILDCGTGIWWSDDKRVASLGVDRFYAHPDDAAGGCPRTEVVAWPLEALDG